MRRLKVFCIVPLLLAGALAANAQSIMSKLYFPGIVGIRFPVQKQGFTYGNGISINTAIEYRPGDKTPVFFRFNFDGSSAKYSGDLSSLPVNVVNGTLHSNNFVLGVGYRRRQKHTGLYFLLQPGITSSSFNRVSGTNLQGYTVDQVSVQHFGIKYSAGFECYLAEHFALLIEPAYYQNNIGSNKGLASISQFSVNMGFTTTLF